MIFYLFFFMMNNPDLIKTGSRHRLALSTQLVYDVWRAGEGIKPFNQDEALPQFGKVGHKIISMLFAEEREALREHYAELYAPQRTD